MATIDQKKFYELESGDQIALENGLRADIMGESEDGQWVGIRYTADAGELAHSEDLLHVDGYDPDLAFCQCGKQLLQSADQTFAVLGASLTPVRASVNRGRLKAVADNPGVVRRPRLRPA